MKITKKILKLNTLIILMGLLTIYSFNVYAAPSTGHEEFNSIEFRYQKDEQLLTNMNSKKLNEMMKKVKKKAFGWSTHPNILNTEVIYESGVIFSRSNKTNQDIKFNYLASTKTSEKTTKTLTGTLALKASGKTDKITGSLDSSIRGEIGRVKETIFEEEFEFNVVIKSNKKISLLIKGVATLSNGASKYYFLGICLNKKYWEYIDVVNEYYELYEENI